MKPIILKRKVGLTVNEKGELRSHDNMPVYIERTGQLRMFLEVPDFVCAALSSSNARGYFSKKSTGFMPGERRIYGRSPEELEKDLRQVLDAYADLMREVKVVPKIFVKFSDASPRYGSGDALSASFNFEIQRFMVEDSGVMYRWREKEDATLQRTYASCQEGTLLDYTPELWEQLVQVRDNFKAGVARLKELLASEETIVQALAGRKLPVLGYEA